MVGYESAYADKVYPGVTVLGMNMAGMGRAEAEGALAQRFAQTYRQGLTLRNGDRVWLHALKRTGREIAGRQALRVQSH